MPQPNPAETFHTATHKEQISLSVLPLWFTVFVMTETCTVAVYKEDGAQALVPAFGCPLEFST